MEKLLALRITNEQWRIKPMIFQPEDQGYGCSRFQWIYGPILKTLGDPSKELNLKVIANLDCCSRLQWRQHINNLLSSIFLYNITMVVFPDVWYIQKAFSSEYFFIRTGFPEKRVYEASKFVCESSGCLHADLETAVIASLRSMMSHCDRGFGVAKNTDYEAYFATAWITSFNIIL